MVRQPVSQFIMVSQVMRQLGMNQLLLMSHVMGALLLVSLLVSEFLLMSKFLFVSQFPVGQFIEVSCVLLVTKSPFLVMTQFLLAGKLLVVKLF